MPSVFCSHVIALWLRIAQSFRSGDDDVPEVGIVDDGASKTIFSPLKK
jgi:hypothetical protein